MILFLNHSIGRFFLLAAFWTLPTLLTLSVSQASSPASCYQFEKPDSPIRSQPMVAMNPEIWCYQNIQHPAGGLFIFNGDNPRAKPELALIVEPDGTLTHGSLLMGEVSVHRVRSAEFNPFSIPLKEPDHRRPRSEPLNPELESSAQEVLAFLLSESAEFASLAVKPGLTQASVPKHAKPWRGYWYAYSNKTLAVGTQSTLAKFDRYVKARTGENPGAQSWEKSHHNYEGISWEGHCNGWAASSIIRPEPKSSRRDPKTGIVFRVEDLKGLLAEKDYCVKTAFFGKRYRGRQGDDIKDIYPAEFHQALTYYIGTLGKPVAVDHKATPAVDNHVISAYKMNIKRLNSTTFSVSNTLTIHKYDKSLMKSTGIAPSYQKTYSYTLETDANGVISGGKWKSGNPDFLWVPLSPMECSSNNPVVTARWTNEITNLPKITRTPNPEEIQ